MRYATYPGFHVGAGCSRRPTLRLAVSCRSTTQHATACHRGFWSLGGDAACLRVRGVTAPVLFILEQQGIGNGTGFADDTQSF
ncbi:hypothetical protein ES708_11503 [subsurface metagenome]